jgi:hypothetical protein
VKLPPEPLRWPLVKSVAWAYEAGDRAQEQGRAPGMVPRVITAMYGRYGARNGAARSD